MVRTFTKLMLLIWKNWLIAGRDLKYLLPEFVGPIIMSLLVMILKRSSTPELKPAVLYNPFCTLPNAPTVCNLTENLPKELMGYKLKSGYRLIYSPKSKLLDVSMDMFKSIIDVDSYPNSRDLENQFYKLNSVPIFAAVQFKNELASETNLPNNVEVAIRFPGELRIKSGADSLARIRQTWETNKYHDYLQQAGPRDPNNPTGGSPFYFQEGFLGLQHLLTYFLILAVYQEYPEKFNKSSEYLPMIRMQRFPHSKFVYQKTLISMKAFMPIFVVSMFYYHCINTCRNIVYEREVFLKDVMRIMGVPNVLHFMGWFVTSLTSVIVTVIIVTSLLNINWGPPLNVFFHNTNVFIFATFMICYGCSMITFCFFISSLFSRASLVAELSFITWFCTLTPYLIQLHTYDKLSLVTKLFTCLSANSCMAYGYILIFRYETGQVGIQWNNVWRPYYEDDTLTLGLVMTMLLVDSVIYTLLAFYFEALFPGKYRMVRKWHFLCSPLYRIFNPRKSAMKYSHSIIGDQFIEAGPEDLKRGIVVQDLTKYFKRTCVVRNVNMTLFEGQVTVLLGHNGAGKTTMISMLCGGLKPTSGTIYVGDLDISTHADEIRENLGICRQDNVLFETLTVQEQIYFFCRLKGLSRAESKLEVDTYLKILSLEDKRNSTPSVLSGGMKRALCVVLSLCGHSKFLLLDEPSAGMDPQARRVLWDLISKEKKGRTILMTTHQMDEADVVGDRIAILAAGRLQCMGTSFFLKKTYGAGYHLIIDKTHHCRVSHVTRLLRHYIPHLAVEGDTGSELKYLLDKNYVHTFERMLAHLEANMNSLGIRSYGISLTTLEEVFLKVDTGNPSVIRSDTLESIPSYEDSGTRSTVSYDSQNKSVKIQTSSDYCISTKELLKGLRLYWNQTLAMLLKRLLVTRRAWRSYLAVAIIVIVYLVLFSVITTKLVAQDYLPDLPVDFSPYDKTTTLIESSKNDSVGILYLNSVKSPKDNVEYVQNITQTLLKLTKDQPITVSMNYLIAATIRHDSIIAWFNNDLLHTPPLSLGKALNAVYQKNFGKEYSIRFIVKPMPLKLKTKIVNTSSLKGIGYQLPFNMSFILSILSANLIVFCTRERLSRFIHLQYISGTCAAVRILVSYVFDVMLFVILSLPLLILFMSLKTYGFTIFVIFGKMLIILTTCGLSVVAFMHLISIFFHTVTTAVMWFFGINLMSGCLLFLIRQILEAPRFELKASTLRTVDRAFSIFPFYGLSTGTKDICMWIFTQENCHDLINIYSEANNYTSPQNCLKYICKYDADECCSQYSPLMWERPGMLRTVILSITWAGIYLKILLLIEYRIFIRIYYATMDIFGSDVSTKLDSYDDDVLQEKIIIQDIENTDNDEKFKIILRNVTKYYGNFLAVNGIHLGIKKYECFGLLGVNGAGKTTTFMMMTGERRMSSGDIIIQGTSIRIKPQKARRCMGYCPQFDALLGELTAKETLFIFAMIRGVPLKKCKLFVENLAQNLDFVQHLRKKVKHLSGGNQRKLSTAVALTGNPNIIILDEPTTGMDPTTKRYLWNSLIEVRDSGKCLILSSHSMEECEALCTRVAIMVNGSFVCLGSIQHLRNKFAKGYTLNVKVDRDPNSEEKKEKVNKHILSSIPNSKMIDSRYDMLNYYIKDDQLVVSRLFGVLENAKRSLPIQDYSIGQMNLEQVFLSFTRHQTSRSNSIIDDELLT